MKQIESLLEVEQGKRYFVMEDNNGEISSAILRADTVKRREGKYGFLIDVFVNFTLETGVVMPGTFEKVFYMAEID